MEAIDLIKYPELNLSIVDGGLKVRSLKPLPPELKVQLIQHKAEIIQLLAGKPGGNVAARPLQKFCRGTACKLYYHSMGRHWCFRTLGEMRWQFFDTETMGKCPEMKQ